MIRKHTRRAVKAAFAISLGVAILIGTSAQAAQPTVVHGNASRRREVGRDVNGRAVRRIVVLRRNGDGVVAFRDSVALVGLRPGGGRLGGEDDVRVREHGHLEGGVRGEAWCES